MAESTPSAASTANQPGAYKWEAASGSSAQPHSDWNKDGKDGFTSNQDTAGDDSQAGTGGNEITGDDVESRLQACHTWKDFRTTLDDLRLQGLFPSEAVRKRHDSRIQKESIAAYKHTESEDGDNSDWHGTGEGETAKPAGERYHALSVGLMPDDDRIRLVDAESGHINEW